MHSKTVSAKELIAIVEEQTSKIQVKDSAARTLFHQKCLSDHEPAWYANDVLEIMSWNVLHPAWMNYLKGGDAGQGFDEYDMAKPEMQDSRMDGIAQQVCIHAGMNMIVCLQEVCPEQLRLITNLFSKMEMSNTIVITRQDDDEDNKNVIIFDSTIFQQLRKGELLPAISHRGVGSTSFITLQLIANKDVVFNVASVHIPFGTNKSTLDALLTNFDHDNKSSYICGDFNASSRAYDGIADSISIYEHPDIKFAVPTTDFYSHINTFENAKTKQRQIDLFDHIMILLMAK